MFGVSQRRVFDWVAELNLQQTTTTSNCEHSHSNTDSTSAPLTQEASSIKKRRLSGRGGAEEAETGKSWKELRRRSVVQMKDEAVDKEMFEWFQSCLPYKPSSTQIRDRARDMFRSRGCSQIQCSYGWYRRWCERYGLSHGYHDERSESEILEWALQQLDKNEILSYEGLQATAQAVISKSKPKFKASCNWVSRFLQRHHVLLNWEGQLVASLPGQLELQAQAFLAKLNSPNMIRMPNICCMDEIPLYFTSNSLDLMEAQPKPFTSPRLGKCSIKHCEATVILALWRDGTLIPPMIIVKSQKKSHVNQVYTKKNNPLVVFYSPTTEPSTASLDKWFELVWPKTGISPAPASSLLLWDSYPLHAELQAKCEQLSIHNEMFPLGCASKLQPLNVLVRQQFLKHVEGEWVKYMGQNMSATQITWPSTNEITDWVHEAYLALKNSKHKLAQSFEAVGFRFGSLHVPAQSQ